jgi:CPA2 family monovalent cation:H+ antiporter-2
MGDISLLRDLAIVMIVASIMTHLAHRLRQPVIIAYLLAGVIIGPHTPPFSLVGDLQSIKTLSTLGLVFIMFSLGLEFNLPKLRRAGPSAVFSAAVVVGGMLGCGFLLGQAFG